MNWTVLPWILLACTITIRACVAKHNKAGFMIDICTIPLWSAWYIHVQAWPLLAVPYIFGYLDMRAILHWWKRAAA